MKKNDILIITGTALYSYLFYAQSAGINFILFSIALIIFLLLKDHSLIKNKPWIFTALGSLLSGIAILLYGTSLSVIANILSLCLMASFSVNRESSLLLAALYSLYSYVSAIPFMIINLVDKKAKEASSTENSTLAKAALILIPVFITLLFFFIYRAANPIFKNFTENISLDFITWPWIRFTILGFILLYTFFNHRKIIYLFNKDLEASDKLKKENFPGDASKLFGKDLSYSNETLSGIILLGLLNVLLLSLNILDINFLWISKTLPEGLTYSEFVHQGIGLLIISIIIAICIILFYFRGGLNFYEKNKFLKTLTYLWIIQNALLIITTASRNELYINEYSLTYKRIGVYVYLLLSFIGIVTTFIKILQVKSNWFLFRKNGWAFYFILIVSCYINWDILITRFNIKHSGELDKSYLLSLSSTTLPDLLTLEHNKIQNNLYDNGYQKNLHRETYDFFKEFEAAGWQSWNLEKRRIKNEIEVLEKEKKIKILDLSYSGINTLSPISEFKNIEHIDLNNNDFRKMEELSAFQNLTYLDISSNQIDSLHKFPSLPLLKELNLSNNRITELNYINNAPALQILIASDNNYLSKFPILKHLKTLDLSRTQIDNYPLLGKYQSLVNLKLNNINKTNLYSLPHFKNLKTLELSNNFISVNDTVIWEKINLHKNLKILDLSSNGIKIIKSIPITPMKSLEEINLSQNQISDLSGIEIFPNLLTLYINNCGAADFAPIGNLSQLSFLTIRDNSISDLAFLSRLTDLKNLDLSANKIERSEVIGKLINLEELNLSNNYLYEIGQIRNLQKLKSLNLANNNNVADISMLSDLHNLEYLSLGCIPIKDIKIFLHMKKLKHLSSCRLDEEQIKYLKAALPLLEINIALTDEVVVDTLAY